MQQTDISQKEHKEKYRYCAATHHPIKCQAYGKLCSGSGKINNFRISCKSSDNRQGIRQDNKQKSQEEHIGNMDSITIRAFCINNTRSMFLTKFEMSSKHVTCQIEYIQNRYG